MLQRVDSDLLEIVVLARWEVRRWVERWEARWAEQVEQNSALRWPRSATLNTVATKLLGCKIFSDEGNYASMSQGIRNSHGSKHIFKHNNPQHLEIGGDWRVEQWHQPAQDPGGEQGRPGGQEGGGVQDSGGVHGIVDQDLRICLHECLFQVGDSGVGKSFLLDKFLDDSSANDFISTIGVDIKTRETTVINKKIKVQVWDTGNDEYYSLKIIWLKYI